LLAFEYATAALVDDALDERKHRKEFLAKRCLFRSIGRLLRDDSSPAQTSSVARMSTQ